MGLQAPQRLTRRAIGNKLAMPLDLDMSRASLHHRRPRESGDVVFSDVGHVEVTHVGGCGWELGKMREDVVCSGCVGKISFQRKKPSASFKTEVGTKRAEEREKKKDSFDARKLKLAPSMCWTAGPKVFGF